MDKVTPDLDFGVDVVVVGEEAGVRMNVLDAKEEVVSGARIVTGFRPD